MTTLSGLRVLLASQITTHIRNNGRLRRTDRQTKKDECKGASQLPQAIPHAGRTFPVSVSDKVFVSET